MMEISDTEFDAITKTIESDDSPAGIDIKKTHVIIIHHLQQIQARLERLESKIAAEND